VIRFLKDKAYVLFFVLFLLSVSPFVVRIFEKKEVLSAADELFKPELLRLNSIDKIIAYTDSLYALHGKTGLDTALYTSTVSHTIKERFCHGMLDYKFSENWIAYLSGKFIWTHMSSIVIAEDILQHGKGLCSQQTIVLMEALRVKGINVKSVGLGYKEGPGHFLCEVRYNGGWHLHDVSVEPVWAKLANDHCSLEYYLSKRDSLFVAYESRIPKATFYKLLEKSSYGEVNKIPAGNMTLFHKTTFFLIYAFPVLFFWMFVRLYRRRSLNKSEAKKPVNDGIKEEKESLIAY
jgi:hypothetical protein